VLSWEERDRLADIEENLAAEDPRFADRMRTSRKIRRVPPPVATVIAVAVAALVLFFLPPVPMIVAVLLIIASVVGTYRWLRRSTGRP
jgi:cobalamin synthase